MIRPGSHASALAPDHLLRAIVESSDDAILTMTLDGVVTSWNPGAERLYGYPPDDAVGRHISFLIPPDRKNEERRILDRVMTGQRVDHYETRRMRKDGTVLDVAVTVSPTLDEGGRIVGASSIAREVSERKAAQRFRALLLESAPDAIVIASRDGRIRLVNRQTEDLFGYGREELLNQPIEILVPQRIRRQHEGHRGGYFTDPRLRPMGAGLELYGVRKDGTEIPVEISLSPMDTDEGPLVFAAIRDVTERRRSEERLQQALRREREAVERLQELDRLKDEFLATVSHELRTPLAAIQGFARILMRGQSTREPPTDLAARIRANALEMGRMIEGLLDYSRLEAGQVALYPEPLRLGQETRGAIDRLADVLDGRAIDLAIPGHLKVMSDRGALDRILGNLLTNAAKFSDVGSPIRVSARLEDATVVVSVADEGVGIPPGEQPYLFDRFFQGSLQVPGRRGAGIGLSIVKRYVELLHGTVWLESEPGKGSTFSFSLPTPDA